MNTNTTNTTTNNTNNGEKSMFKMLKRVFTEMKTCLLYFAIFAAIFLSLQYLPVNVAACIVLFVLGAGAMRIILYLSETKKNRIKRSLLSFLFSIYTQTDFENFREKLSNELYKEMKNNAYVEISTEEDLAQKDSEKMDAFLEKHYRNSEVFYADEKDLLSEAARYLVWREQNDVGEECTLKDIEKFLNQTREKLLLEIMNIYACKNGGYRDLCLAPGIADFCTDKKALKSLRAKLRTAFTDSEIKLHDFSQQELLAGENEATFRC